eukprot:2840032-Pyramimonas_sp.AAC.1
MSAFVVHDTSYSSQGPRRPSREALYWCLQRGWKRAEFFDALERRSTQHMNQAEVYSDRGDVDSLNSQLVNIINESLEECFRRSLLRTEDRRVYSQRVRGLSRERRQLREQVTQGNVSEEEV